MGQKEWRNYTQIIRIILNSIFFLDESKNNTIQFNFTEETDKENDVDVEEVEMKKASCSMTQQSPMRDFNCEDFLDFFVKHLY